MEIKRWFDYSNEPNAIANKKACEKSIQENRCVKVHAGRYYYKGYEVYYLPGHIYPWNWKSFSDIYTFSESTKRDCLLAIDGFINTHKNLFKENT